ncbi:hypothetical protein ACIRP0_15125 [Streptomyces sp. NPDC101733]|uniref:hypothetical protein n=1 Tax=unclassified Streptomyces TaxID=2593676 RepID=UPI00380BA949
MAVVPSARTRSAAVAALPAAALSAVSGGPAHAFTGVDHENITRAALPWEPVTLNAMADARDGAVNANDHRPSFDVGPLHRDNADYLGPRYAPGYPRTRDEATTEFLACVRTSWPASATRSGPPTVSSTPDDLRARPRRPDHRPPLTARELRR